MSPRPLLRGTTPIRVGLVVEEMRVGGLESFVLRLGRGLAGLGAMVTVVTTERPGPWFPRITEAGLRDHDLSAARAPRGFLAQARHAVSVGRGIAAQRFDVVFVNHVASLQAALGLLPNEQRVVPVLHNVEPFVYQVGCANARGWDVVVAVGPRVAEEARRRVGSARVREIWNGVDEPLPEALATRAVPGSPCRIVVVGRLDHSQKGILHLPGIMRRLLDAGHQVHLTVLGDGPDRAALESALVDRGVRAFVELKGVVPESQVYEAMLASHLLLMPSYYEGMPLSLLEAQICGCVPVASRLPGITDAVLHDGKCGVLVPPGDEHAFAAAIGALIGDVARWARFSAAAVRYARERFTTAVMVDSYAALLGELLTSDAPLAYRRGAPLLNPRLLPWQDSLPAWALGGARRLHRRLT